jgi:hypothetical protein
LIPEEQAVSPFLADIAVVAVDFFPSVAVYDFKVAEESLEYYAV